MRSCSFGRGALYTSIMKTSILLLLLVFGAAMQAQSHDNFIGSWASDDESQIMEIYLQDAAYYAKIISSRNPESKDKIVLIQMGKKSDTQLYGGTYYDLELKTETEAKLKLMDSNTIRLKELSGLFNKTFFWHRVPLPWSTTANEITVIQH